MANYSNAGYGYLDVVEATTNSVNTIYARMMNEVVTPQKFMEVAARTGISIPPTDSGCALALGTTDVTPLEMAGAYTTFAQRGRRPTPLVISRITRPGGAIVAERPPAVAQVVDPNVADTVNYVLERNIRSGTGTGAKIAWPAAGKTGTTENFQDAWFAGYTPELTAVVWMGFAPNPDGRIPVMSSVRGRSVTGGSFPATIWKNFMTRAMEGKPATKFHEPEFGGEVINHRPPPPKVEVFEWPDLDLNFPPCFPFCTSFERNQGRVNEDSPTARDLLEESLEERRRQRSRERESDD
ncbi:hypothetical protein BH23ACT12_BH23ACT12_06710 [soil metagenome]